MENPEFQLKIPNELCQQIFNCQFELDIGNVSEQLISRTIELYSEAMTFFISQKLQTLPVRNRAKFYQDKIKRLLTRKDVENCLVGKKVNQRSIDIEHEVLKIRESAPEQAKALIQYFKAQHACQEQMIRRSMEEQNSKLTERIARRSRSRSNCGQSPAKSAFNPKKVALLCALKQF